MNAWERDKQREAQRYTLCCHTGLINFSEEGRREGFRPRQQQQRPAWHGGAGKRRSPALR